MPDTKGMLGERPATFVGLLTASVVLFGAVPRWPGTRFLEMGSIGSPVAFGFGLLIAAAFTAGRHVDVDRATVAVVAGFGGLGAISLAIWRLIVPAIGAETAPPMGIGIPLTMIGGFLALSLGIADYKAVSAERLVAMFRHVAIGFALAIGGLVVMTVFSIPLQPVRDIQDEATRITASILLSPLIEIGLVVLAVGFVLTTDRGWSYFDVSKPSLRGVAAIILGVVALLSVQIFIAQTIEILDLPSSPNSLVEPAQRAAELGKPELILLLVPMMILVVGPAEELLYRNVIQKYLYGVFSEPTAIVMASFPFAVAHYQAYYSANSAGLFVSLSAILLLSLVLGTIYWRTENIVVTAFVHGIYNAILVLFLYVSLILPEDVAGATLF